jgi:hypothetical protein
MQTKKNKERVIGDMIPQESRTKGLTKLLYFTKPIFELVGKINYMSFLEKTHGTL